MNISIEDRLLIYKTFAIINERPGRMEKLGDLLYQNLFHIAPETQLLFSGPLHEQSRKWRQMLTKIIVTIDHFASLDGDLSRLGLKHVAYGVRAADYEKMGEALLLSLEQYLGADFTPDARTAWSRMYNAVSAAMLETTAENTDQKST